MNKTKKCVGKEGFQRMNYLYQISNEACKNMDSKASVYYSQLMVNISKKVVQRLEPQIKRRICKHCNGLMINGVTCKVRIRKKYIIWTCERCGTQKKFKATKGYKIWAEKQEAIVETLDYSCQKQINLT